MNRVLGEKNMCEDGLILLSRQRTGTSKGKVQWLGWCSEEEGDKRQSWNRVSVT